METRVVAVSRKAQQQLGRHEGGLEEWRINADSHPDAVATIAAAAEYLGSSDTPVAFPTETVYGLGADATRSRSVKGIYAAKGRPSDNPLIVHIADLTMLRELLEGDAPLPPRYQTLIEKFWPGPLTILLPNASPSRLAPEVTAGLTTFGVRMPSSQLALSLIKLAGVPVAAPSANASTRPSPTSAHHVKDDLDGRIELILDGGPCDVGVESTVVDGLCEPPVVLRPGGISMAQLRSCPGWEGVVKAYKDQSEEGRAAPRAPGMKYKHYSPRARVVLYEASSEHGRNGIDAADVGSVSLGNGTTNGNGHVAPVVGVVRTKRWKTAGGLRCGSMRLAEREASQDAVYEVFTGSLQDEQGHDVGQVLDIDLGSETRGIAQGLFSALRALDSRGATVIFVDGIDDELDIAAAVMNRLRKAASETRA